MAYINDPTKKNQGQGGAYENDLYSQGSAMAGSGQTGVGDQSKQTTAGTAGGWYNVQDFLKANEGDSTLKQGIQRTGNELIDKAKQESQNLISQADETFKASGQPILYDPQKMQQASGQDIYGYLNQGQKEAQRASFDLSGDVKNQAKYLEDPSFKNMIEFNKYGLDQSATYTPGMAAMDEALLLNDPSFTTSFLPKLGQQYQQNVSEPLKVAEKNYQARADDLNRQYDRAGESWGSGIKGFLGEQQEAIERQKNEMQEQADYTQNRTPWNMMSDEQRALADQYGIDQNNIFRFDQGTGVSDAAAANRALGSEGIERYNMLSDLLSQTNQDFEYNPLQGQEYIAPSWSFDENNFNALVSQRQAETQAAEAQQQAKLQAEQNLRNDITEKYNNWVNSMGANPYQSGHIAVSGPANIGLTDVEREYVEKMGWDKIIPGGPFWERKPEFDASNIPSDAMAGGYRGGIIA